MTCLTFQLQIWDTAGQERFRSITQSYYRHADAIVLVYDIGCVASFMNLPEWLKDIEKSAGELVHCAVVGNKSDRYDREVLKHKGTEFARERKMTFLETSAKNASNVEQLFTQLARTLKELHEQERQRNAKRRSTTITVTPVVREQNSRVCC